MQSERHLQRVAAAKSVHDTQDDGDKDDGSNDDDNNSNYQKRSNVDDISQSGFSNASLEHTKTRDASNNDHEDNDLLTQMTAAKPLYQDKLICNGRNDTVAMDVQLIKGVLPDLFAVLKFLESDDNLVFNGIICCYFIKNCKLLNVSNTSGGSKIATLSGNWLMEGMLLSAI